MKNHLHIFKRKQINYNRRMVETLNSTYLSLFIQNTIEEHDDEKEVFIFTHDHNNGPIR